MSGCVVAKWPQMHVHAARASAVCGARVSRIMNVASSQRPGMANVNNIPAYCRTVARHASRQLAPGDPGELRSCPKAAEHMPQSCHQISPGAGLSQMWGDAGQHQQNLGPQRLILVNVGLILVKWIRDVAGIWPNVVGAGRGRDDSDQPTSVRFPESAETTRFWPLPAEFDRC